jgi:hypothetical protein
MRIRLQIPGTHLMVTEEEKSLMTSGITWALARVAMIACRSGFGDPPDHSLCSVKPTPRSEQQLITPLILQLVSPGGYFLLPFRGNLKGARRQKRASVSTANHPRDGGLAHPCSSSNGMRGKKQGWLLHNGLS